MERDMSKKVLAVDDSPSIRAMVTLVLKSAGFDVTEAASGDDGLAKAKAETFNLILTDQNMPGMDGVTLVRNLRQLGHCKATPILILTTESSDAMKAQGKAAGATGWLVKPFDPDKLIAVVNKVVV
jgi:two-component system chemotaxis response regulator CheY